MGDFFELAAKRRSVRKFSETPVERWRIEKMVAAAALSPSALNTQPWRVVAAADPESAREFAEIAAIRGRNSFFAGTPAFLAVLEERVELASGPARFLDGGTYAKGDLGGFVLSLCFAAEELGLGTCVIGTYDRARVRDFLKLPDHVSPFLLVALGHPAEPGPVAKSRLPLETILKFL